METESAKEEVTMETESAEKEVANEPDPLKEDAGEDPESADKEVKREPEPVKEPGKYDNTSVQARLEKLDRLVASTFSMLSGKTVAIMDMDADEEIGVGEKVDMVLFGAFKKFRDSEDSKMTKEKFHEAWGFLNLQATNEEVSKVFDQVDKEGSGLINFEHFQEAVIKHRNIELSIQCLSAEMEGHLEGLAQYIDQLREVQFGKKFKEKNDELEETLSAKDSQLRFSLARIRTLEGDEEEGEAGRSENRRGGRRAARSREGEESETTHEPAKKPPPNNCCCIIS